MQNITFDTKARIQLPPAKNPHLQSIYLFNMYRAGSSITEAIAQSLAFGSLHTEFNLVQKLDEAGVGLVDHADFSRHSVYINPQTLSLDTLGSLGGYLYYGFREIPRPYADRFIYHGASVIVARDPRDIAISQYAAVKKHVVAGASGSDILRLRDMTNAMQLEEFLLSESTISFVKRITNCYAPLIRSGCKLIHYEEFMLPDRYDTDNLMRVIVESLGGYIQLQRPFKALAENLDQRVQNSKALKGHATGGQIHLYRALPVEVRKKLNTALRFELMMLGYL